MFLCIMSLTIYNQEGDVPKQINTVIWYLKFQFLPITTAKVADESVMKTENDALETEVKENLNDRKNLTANSVMMMEKKGKITPKMWDNHIKSNYKVTW